MPYGWEPAHVAAADDILAGAGEIEHGLATYAVATGDVVLLPAIVGVCTFRPHGAVSVLEIALPDVMTTMQPYDG